MLKIPWLLIIIFSLFTSCGNPKADIVEKEKDVKWELSKIQAEQDLIEIKRQKLFEKYKDIGFTGADFLQEAKVLRDSDNVFRERKSLLQYTYDSLEMELKKY